MNLIYVDDSGDESCTIFSALWIPEIRWRSYLKGWLTYRKQLYRDHLIPADYELHAQDWLSKRPEWPEERGQPPDIIVGGKAARKSRGQRYEKALKVISTFHDARLFTVYADGVDKLGLYEELIGWLDEALSIENEFGLVLLDGLDQGHRYRASHRRLVLRDRCLLEDPMECASHGSQLIQMADLCAHAAFRYVRDLETDPIQLRQAFVSTLAPIVEIPPVGFGDHIWGWK